MPGMNTGLDPGDPTVVAAFRSALLHQGLIALVILVALLLSGARPGVGAGFGRGGASAAVGGRRRAAGRGARPGAGRRAAWRRVLRIGFGLLWLFDGILQAQPAMAVGLPSQVIEPSAATSPDWVQHLVNWAGTAWSYHPVQAGAAAVWIQVGIGLWLLFAARGAAVAAGRAGRRRLGPGRVGVRRVVRRGLRARA